jgi:hypothetical protein
LFDEIVSNPISRSPAFAKLRDFILLVTSQAITRIQEDPTIVLDLFFSKLRADCLRIQNNENNLSHLSESLQPLPESIDLMRDFSIPSDDPVLRQHQVRKLSQLVSRSVDGDEFLRWLSKSLRMIMYGDLDVLEDLDISGGILISHFLDCGAAPSFVEAYIKNETIGMLLYLIGFDKVVNPDTFKFPLDIQIEMIEAVERTKLFQRRAAPPSKTVKSRRRALDKLDDFNSEEDEESKVRKPAGKDLVEYKSEMVDIFNMSSSWILMTVLGMKPFLNEKQSSGVKWMNVVAIYHY